MSRWGDRSGLITALSAATVAEGEAMIRSVLCFLLVAWSSSVACADTSSAFEPAPCAFQEVPAEWATQNRVDCGWLRVPESRGKSDSRTLKLWVAIARADAADKPEAPLLYI